MGLNLKTYKIPDGARMFVHSEQGQTVRGSYTSFNHKHYGGLSVMPVQGDTLVIELFVPAGDEQLAAISLESIAHHYKPNMFKQPQTPAPADATGESFLRVHWVAVPEA
jgi:hypothetical protein